MNEYRGIVKQGVVVVQGTALPEGTEVTIIPVNPVMAPTGPADTASIWHKLAQLGVEAEHEPGGLPPDLAANHDHYLHGLPRRQ